MEKQKNGKQSFSFLRATHFHINGGILLMIVVLLAMLVANSPWSDAYTAFWNKEVYLQVGNFNLFNHHGHPMTLATFINDVLISNPTLKKKMVINTSLIKVANVMGCP